MDSQDFIDISVRRRSNFADIRRALDIVHKEIIKNKWILYGGMSVHLSLLAAGHKGVYSDSVLPDYDFYTPDAYDVSNQLADKLHKENIPELSSINAGHINTRRVRVSFKEVADISYMPRSIYDKLPFIEFKGLRVVHPHFQRLDMHRAFAYPLEQPPLETFSFRAKKDQTRMALLDKYYPMPDPKYNPGFTTKTYKMQPCVLNGLAAYGYYWSQFKLAGCVPVSVKIGTDLVVNTPPLTPVVSWYSEDSVKLAKSLKCKKFKERYMDNLKPRCAEIDDIEIVDTRGRLLMATKIPGTDSWIAHPQAVSLALLCQYFISSDTAWLAIYNSMMKLMAHAETLNTPEIAAVWFLTPSVYGTRNWNYTYYLNYCRQVYMCNGDQEGAEALKKLRPLHGYYPERGNPPPEFIQNTWIYAMSAASTTAFSEIELPAML